MAWERTYTHFRYLWKTTYEIRRRQSISAVKAAQNGVAMSLVVNSPSLKVWKKRQGFQVRFGEKGIKIGLTRTRPCWYSVLGYLKLWENKLWENKSPLYGILLRQPEETKTCLSKETAMLSGGHVAGIAGLEGLRASVPYLGSEFR